MTVKIQKSGYEVAYKNKPGMFSEWQIELENGDTISGFPTEKAARKTAIEMGFLMGFYMREIQNSASYRSWIKLDATSWTEAKREASRKQAFYGTVLEIVKSYKHPMPCDTTFDYRKENGKWVE